VGQFGLTNAVFAVDTFVEVVAPARPDTTAGRYLERRGGDGRYMAIFQVPDLAPARRRLASLGVRVVWTADLPDIAATHLHPKDANLASRAGDPHQLAHPSSPCFLGQWPARCRQAGRPAACTPRHTVGRGERGPVRP